MYNRQTEGGLPAIVVVIDNYDIHKEVDEMLDTFVTGIARDGMSMGIYVVLTASRPGVLRFGLSGGIKSKMSLYMYDKSETTTVVGRTDFGIKDLRGRALVKLDEACALQIYTVADISDEERYLEEIGDMVSELEKRNKGYKVSSIRTMPKELSTPLLCDYAESEQLEANVVPIGLTTESLEITGIRLAESLYIVAGGVASGRTNLLKVIINAINPSIRVFVVDDKAQELLTVCTASNVTYVSNKDANRCPGL